METRREVLLFGRYNIAFSERDWEFMCKNRWFTDSPSVEEMEAEFGLCGLRDARDDADANELVASVVSALREIRGLDIEQKCDKAIRSNSNLTARMDKNGNVLIDEV